MDSNRNRLKLFLEHTANSLQLLHNLHYNLQY